jgi:hypothetical protein
MCHDAARSARIATEHLIRLVHERIAYVSFAPPEYDSVRVNICTFRTCPVGVQAVRFQRIAPTLLTFPHRMSVNARDGTKEGISVLRNAGPYSPASKLLHGDELAFKQRIKFFPLGDLVGRVADQHQCREFMGAEHACLLIARVGGIASAQALAFDGALPVTHSLQYGAGS